MSRSTDLNRAIVQSSQDAYCRRSHTWICKFTLLHQTWCTSWYWSIVLDEESSLLTTFTAPLGGITSCIFPLVWSVHRTSSRRRWASSSKSALMYWNCQWHHCTWLYWGGTQHPSAEPHVGSPQVWSCVQSTENTHKGPSHKLLWLPIWCQWCPPRPREGRCCACSPAPTMSLNSKSSLAWWPISAP